MDAFCRSGRYHLHGQPGGNAYPALLQARSQSGSYDETAEDAVFATQKCKQLQDDAWCLHFLPDPLAEVDVGFTKKTKNTMFFQYDMAEGVGFEPTIRFPVYTLSKRAPSATRPPLRSTWNVRNRARRPQVTTRAWKHDRAYT